MKLKVLLTIALVLATWTSTNAQLAAHFDMSLIGGQITESVTGQKFACTSQLPACTINGIDGTALRFDGYSNYIKASLPVSSFSTDKLTASVWLAAETYPMMQVDVAETTPTYATICGNLDETAKKGFALQLSSQGHLRLQVYVNYGSGFLVTVDGAEKLPRGQWCNVAMTFDKSGNAVTLHLNGTAIGTKKSNRCDLLLNNPDFFIGKDAKDVKAGPFLINTFCGAIDDIAIYNSVAEEFRAKQEDFASVRYADFSYPASRYEGSLWRPLFHGMPSGSWTNESHGMAYSGGRYHLFFQKNANGPYMSRLHWGHISSKNLYDWREEPIAIYPGEWFDMKGCWSGCVYERGGNTYLLYTAVDNERARIVQARALDDSLTHWGEKKVIIDGRPAGLSDDFRDPYCFEANGHQYVIVGTSKNGIGACTLHQLTNGTWTNDGSIFFQGSNAAQHGTFWEMPNVTPMGNGRFLFTCTPLSTASGVRTLCWTGAIGSDGTFQPDNNGVQYLEMGGISRDGYGLLSPTILQKDGTTLLLGIVPDKLAQEENYKMGWAHNYSLPRELTIDANGLLMQKPYSGLAAMRTASNFYMQKTLEGAESLSPICGRHIELLGEFTVADGICGFHFLKSGNSQASLDYNPATGILKLDYTSLARVATDGGTWSARLPQKVNAGETLKLHVYLDGSIVDIFVNDRWAFSTRIFPTDANAIGTEVFADVPTAAKVSAWVLDAKQDADGIMAPQAYHGRWTKDDGADAVYDISGCRRNGITQKGIYIKNGMKYVGR